MTQAVILTSIWGNRPIDSAQKAIAQYFATTSNPDSR